MNKIDSKNNKIIHGTFSISSKAEINCVGRHTADFYTMGGQRWNI